MRAASRKLRIIRFAVCALSPPVLGALPFIVLAGLEPPHQRFERLYESLSITALAFVCMGIQSTVFAFLMNQAVWRISKSQIMRKRTFLTGISTGLGILAAHSLAGVSFWLGLWHGTLTQDHVLFVILFHLNGGIVGAIVGAFVSLRLAPELQAMGRSVEMES